MMFGNDVDPYLYDPVNWFPDGPWTVIPELTASEKIEQDVLDAKRELRKFISELTAKHISAIRGNKLPNGVLQIHCDAINPGRIDYTVDGRSFYNTSAIQVRLRLLVTYAEFERKGFNRSETVTVEDYYYPGDWVVEDISLDKRYGWPGVTVNLLRVYGMHEDPQPVIELKLEGIL